MPPIPLNNVYEPIIYKYHCKKCDGLNVWRSILGKEFINEPDLDNEIFQRINSIVMIVVNGLILNQ